VLAGGALSGSAERYPIASPPPEPIGSAMSYEADVRRASRIMPLVKEGFATSLTEAATRFAISHPAMGTILVSMATPQQFEAALAAVQKGPLPPAALERLTAFRQGFAGETRLRYSKPVPVSIAWPPQFPVACHALVQDTGLGR
jgi:aryl-alcohol dehydrogenase-like predicted oxidoreductase